MGFDRDFDLARIDVEAARDEHFLHATHNLQVAVRPYLHDVAGAEPAIGGIRVGGRLGVAEVAGEKPVAPGLDLALSARLDDGARGVADPDVEAGVWLADGPG